jgi:hypothetical protein
MYPIQNTDIVRTIIEYYKGDCWMYPIQNTDIIRTIIEYD